MANNHGQESVITRAFWPKIKSISTFLTHKRFFSGTEVNLLLLKLIVLCVSKYHSWLGLAASLSNCLPTLSRQKKKQRPVSLKKKNATTEDHLQFNRLPERLVVYFIWTFFACLGVEAYMCVKSLCISALMFFYLTCACEPWSNMSIWISWVEVEGVLDILLFWTIDFTFQHWLLLFHTIYFYHSSLWHCQLKCSFCSFLGFPRLLFWRFYRLTAALQSPVAALSRQYSSLVIPAAKRRATPQEARTASKT